MKTLLFFAIAIGFVFEFPAQAQQAEVNTKELDALKIRYQSDIQAAAKPIQTRYISDLTNLQKALTQRGDLNGALAVQAELKNMGGEPATASTIVQQSGFSGTVWENKTSGSVSKITFRVDGTWSEDYKTSPLKGHWKPTADAKIAEVKISNGDIIHYKMSDDGATCNRQEAQLTFDRKK